MAPDEHQGGRALLARLLNEVFVDIGKTIILSSEVSGAYGTRWLTWMGNVEGFSKFAGQQVILPCSDVDALESLNDIERVPVEHHSLLETQHGDRHYRSQNVVRETFPMSGTTVAKAIEVSRRASYQAATRNLKTVMAEESIKYNYNEHYFIGIGVVDLDGTTVAMTCAALDCAAEDVSLILKLDSVSQVSRNVATSHCVLYALMKLLHRVEPSNVAIRALMLKTWAELESYIRQPSLCIHEIHQDTSGTSIPCTLDSSCSFCHSSMSLFSDTITSRPLLFHGKCHFWTFDATDLIESAEHFVISPLDPFEPKLAIQSIKKHIDQVSNHDLVSPTHRIVGVLYHHITSGAGWGDLIITPEIMTLISTNGLYLVLVKSGSTKSNAWVNHMPPLCFNHDEGIVSANNQTTTIVWLSSPERGTLDHGVQYQLDLYGKLDEENTNVRFLADVVNQGSRNKVVSDNGGCDIQESLDVYHGVLGKKKHAKQLTTHFV